MFRALERLFGFDRWRDQLSLELESRPRDAEELCARLVRLGLDPDYRCQLTSNRSVFVSYSDHALRLHKGYLDAPEETWKAIVEFVSTKSRVKRRAARKKLLEYDVHRGQPLAPRVDRPRRIHPDDEAMAERLRRAHESFNKEKFNGELAAIPILVSRRMRSRLGHYTHRDPSGGESEIVISRRHVRRHGWNGAHETLIHEMIHQWQDESGRAIDHGREFRAKAREVGIHPRARTALRTEDELHTAD